MIRSLVRRALGRASVPPTPTRAEYDAARPFHKGFMASQFGGRNGIPTVDLCPFAEGSHDREVFDAGVRRAEFDAERQADE